MLPDRVIRIGGTTVEIWQGNCCRTILPDGRHVMAAPQDTDDYRQRAWNLGYRGDVFRMCVEHETAHALLAHIVLDAPSPTLCNVAAGGGRSTHTDHEENAVLAFQLFCNTFGVNLLDLAERYGNRLEAARVAAPGPSRLDGDADMANDKDNPHRDAGHARRDAAHAARDERHAGKVYEYDDGSGTVRNVNIIGKERNMRTVRDTSTGEEFQAQANQLRGLEDDETEDDGATPSTG